MKIRRSDYEKALAKHYGVLPPSAGRPFVPQVEGVLRELGIEIVPDPEPESRRPLRVEVSPQGVTVSTIFDADNRIFLTVRNSDPESARETRKALDSLVSAYNAAGERKRVEITRDGMGWWAGKWDAGPFLVREAAIGHFVSDHASDLGLEIAES